MGKFNSDDHYIYYCGQESLRRNGVALIVNKRVQNTVLGHNLKNDKIISVHFQGKPFNITVIQVNALTSNAEEAEVEWFYEDLQDLQELTHKKDLLFIFQCLIFLRFRFHGVLKARIVKWFAIPFSSVPRFVRSLHHDPSVLGGPTQHGS